MGNRRSLNIRIIYPTFRQQNRSRMRDIQKQRLRNCRLPEFRYMFKRLCKKSREALFCQPAEHNARGGYIDESFGVSGFDFVVA